MSDDLRDAIRNADSRGKLEAFKVMLAEARANGGCEDLIRKVLAGIAANPETPLLVIIDMAHAVVSHRELELSLEDLA